MRRRKYADRRGCAEGRSCLLREFLCKCMGPHLVVLRCTQYSFCNVYFHGFVQIKLGMNEGNIVCHGYGFKQPVDTCSVKLKVCAQTETSWPICLCDGVPNNFIAVLRLLSIE